MENLISSFYDLKLYGGAFIDADRLICSSSGDYASIRIQADPLSEITVRCLCKATGTPDRAGISIAYPDVTSQITSVAADVADFVELELKFTVPIDIDNDGYVDIRFGSTTTGTAWLVKPVIKLDNPGRFAGGLIAGCAIIVSGGSATFNGSHSNFGVESVAIDASLLWMNVVLSNGYAASGSALLPVVTATLDPNSSTNVTKLLAGNFGGTDNKTFRLYAVDSSNNPINLSTAGVRAFVSVVGF